MGHLYWPKLDDCHFCRGDYSDHMPAGIFVSSTFVINNVNKYKKVIIQIKKVIIKVKSNKKVIIINKKLIYK